MKEYDRVKVIVEKEAYAKDGVHKDMVGWICDERIISNQRLVCFDECNLPIFPIVPIKIDDLEVVWESPRRQVGDKVTLIFDKYKHLGINKGLKGTICAKGSNDGQWVVHFDSQAGLRIATTLTVDDNDIIADY